MITKKAKIKPIDKAIRLIMLLVFIMDWTNFSSHESSKDQSFETLCDQLFEAWCRRTWQGKISSFLTFNGAGGDGGVEALAILTDQTEVGLQAKWFPTSLTANQINQIKNSLVTAKKNHPALKEYVVAVPRNLAPQRGDSQNPERIKWDDFRAAMGNKFPDVEIVLWDDSAIGNELQNYQNGSIYRYWFEKSEIADETLTFAFEKSKASWLSTKYEPNLNVPGKIDERIRETLGDSEIIKEDQTKISQFQTSSKEACLIIDEIKSLLSQNNNPQREISPSDIGEQLDGIKKSFEDIQNDVLQAAAWLSNEDSNAPIFSTQIKNLDLRYLKDFSSELEKEYVFTSLFKMLSRRLKTISDLRLAEIIKRIEWRVTAVPLLILGGPGTGKTQGVAAITKALLSEDVHTPILIPADAFGAKATWKEILVSTLGQGSDWDEESLFGGLTSLAYRKKNKWANAEGETSATPKVLIIIDAIDEAPDIPTWKSLAREASVITQKYPLIRFCFTARPWVFEKEERAAFSLLELPESGDADFNVLFPKYLVAYQIQAPFPERLRITLNNPLSLKLFCECYQGRSLPPTSMGSSIVNLIDQKLKKLESVFAIREGLSEEDGYVCRAFLSISQVFIKQKQAKRAEVMATLRAEEGVDTILAGKILDFLKDNGIVGSDPINSGKTFAPKDYLYSPGPQSYFDYAAAEIILQKFNAPDKIDFAQLPDLQPETLLDLAIISMERYGYFLLENPSLNLDFWSRLTITCLALRETTIPEAPRYEELISELLRKSPYILRYVTNKLIIPLAQQINHPLGVKILDRFLSSFTTPVQRDEIWSLPDDIQTDAFYTGDELALKNKNYTLTKEDAAEGCPTLYAWALSSLANPDRKYYRVELLRWGREAPEEFFKLYLHFAHVNDPQIRSDMTALLMCVIFQDSKRTILEKATRYLMANVLDPANLDKNRNIAIRFYAIAIIRESVLRKIVTPEEARPYLPPYIFQNMSACFNQDALINGSSDYYDGMDYDSWRYILTDEISNAIQLYRHIKTEEVDSLLDRIKEIFCLQKQPNLAQVIISLGDAYLHRAGWHKISAYSYDQKARKRIGVDSAICHAYPQEDHGTETPNMSIHEKYLRQARNEIFGFLTDRLPARSETSDKKVTDYEQVTSFLIPSEEEEQSRLKIWQPFLPETESLLLAKSGKNQKEICENIKKAPELEVDQWVFTDNKDKRRPLAAGNLVLLSGYSTFGQEKNIQTRIWTKSVIVNQSDLPVVLQKLKEGVSKKGFDLNYWASSTYRILYLSPDEICWFPWKEWSESAEIEEFFPHLNVSSTIESCTGSVIGIGDVSYDLPSRPLRNLLHIASYDGQNYCSENGMSKVFYETGSNDVIDYQESLWGNKDEILSLLAKQNKTLLFVIEVEQMESLLARDRFGEFQTRKFEVLAGSFNQSSLQTTLCLKNIEPNEKTK